MIMLVKGIGILIACMGIIIFLSPQVTKRMLAFWRKGKRLYTGGVVRVLFGLIFLSAASQARVPVVMAGLGILSLAAGILIFILGLERMKVLLGWWDKRPASFVRLMGLLVSAFGALIFSCA